MTDFQSTALWINSLGASSSADTKGATERLRSGFMLSRAAASRIVDTIRDSCPELTLHNIEHLDAVWDAADLVSGPNFKLNPMEAYVFGLSILVHDTGHALVAFPGGLEELKHSNEWRDSVTDAYRSKYEDKEKVIDFATPEPALFSQILFRSLRKIHAKVAEQLPFFEIRNPRTSDVYRLISDDQLRVHYGRIIGLIGSSHHWPIEFIQAKLPAQINALPGFPRDWFVDPIKLACLLRCADAVQIDQRRAPDFLFALLNLHGVSVDHWFAQNRLAQPVVDPYQTDAIVFTSTTPFLAKNASAWWIAYDLIQLADRELSNCHRTLVDTKRLPLQVSRIAGANTAESLAKYVQVEGWSPVDARIRVSDTVGLARRLGGEQLYGHDARIPLRELIQNAADGIKARRALEPENRSFTGRILITHKQYKDCHEICVKDNGVGMSRQVLTGPLIDFGSSLWKGDLIESEFPGLKSSSYRSIGKFGIGFFSVFMIADSVEVISRRFNLSHETGHKLAFPNGLSLRPILAEVDGREFSSGYSTAVKYTLTKKRYDEMMLLTENQLVGSDGDDISSREIAVSLETIVGLICPMLDCEVLVADGKNDEKPICRADWWNESNRSWLQRIYAPISTSSRSTKYLNSLSRRVRPITVKGEIVGRGAINHQRKSANGVILAHGGLAATLPGDMNKSLDILGAVNAFAISADRKTSELGLSVKDLEPWIKEQCEIAINSPLSALEKNYIGHFAAHRGLIVEDLLDFSFRLVGSKIKRNTNMKDLATELSNGAAIIIVLSNQYYKSWPRGVATADREPHDFFIKIIERVLKKYTNLFFAEVAYGDDEYLEVPEEFERPLAKTYLGTLVHLLKKHAPKFGIALIEDKQDRDYGLSFIVISERLSKHPRPRNKKR